MTDAIRDGNHVPVALAVSSSDATITLPLIINPSTGNLKVEGTGNGDVIGPASSTDNAIARFNDTTGKVVQNSVVTIADATGNMAGVGTLNTHTIPGGTGTIALTSNIVTNTSITVYGAGTAYTLTNTATALDFGTTDPTIVLNVAGTYLISGQINLAYNGATVSTETATLKVRRTNNTAADLSAVVVLDLPVSTILTNTYGIFQIPPFVYTTVATDDSVSIFGNVSAGLGAGSIDVTAIGTSLVAIRLS